MSFAAAVDHLHALGQELSPTVPRRKFDLDHMRILARALGDPQTRFPSVLIAGTNGKGSTAATLAAILTATGLRTGLYTSPHLSRVTERIRVSTPNACHSERSEESPHLSPAAPGLSFRSEVEESAFQPATSNLQPSTLYEIPEEAFARLYFHVDSTANRLVATGALPHHPSFFETLTALAFLYFADHQPDGTFGNPIDIAVLEVGLGGRLDATNIVEPILSVLTDIALDHQDYLGNTLTEIAREKAGILRPNGTLITLPQHPEANQAIGEAAIALNVRALNAAPYLPTRDTVLLGNPSLQAWASPPAQEEGALAPGASSPLTPNHYDLPLNGELLKVRSPLPGSHQQRNISLAIAAAIELRNHIRHNSTETPKARNQTSYTSTLEPLFHIPNAAIEAGIAATSWPGRLEFLSPNLLLDVAHNPAGAWALRAAISSLPEDQPRTLLFSCLRDKDLTEMARILFPLFDAPPGEKTVIRSEGVAAAVVEGPAVAFPSNLEPRTLNLVLTPIDNPRAASLDDLIAAARALDIPAHPARTPAEALALARALTPPNGLIIATGSVYLIGAIREAALGF